MPTYEYACDGCGHEFERFESITAAPNRRCPKCNKKKAQRRISGGGGLLFKGSGFYITDYKRNGSSGGETKPKEAKETTAASGCAGGGCACHPASKSESKPAKAAT